MDIVREDLKNRILSGSSEIDIKFLDRYMGIVHLGEPRYVCSPAFIRAYIDEGIAFELEPIKILKACCIGLNDMLQERLNKEMKEALDGSNL